MEKTKEKRVFGTRPIDYIQLCIRIITTALKPIGINVTTNCRVTWTAYLCAITAFQQSLLGLYTAYYYWDTNKLSSMQPLAILAITIPVISTFNW